MALGTYHRNNPVYKTWCESGDNFGVVTTYLTILGQIAKSLKFKNTIKTKKSDKKPTALNTYHLNNHVCNIWREFGDNFYAEQP